MTKTRNLLQPGIPLLLAAGIGWLVYQQLQQSGETGNKPGKGDRLPAPVEVAEVRRGDIDLVRSFTGTLEARAEFIVAPKVSGRVERMHVDLADVVNRGQLVAELDNAEYVQDVARADADLVVAQAKQTEAESLLAIAQRELKRFDQLSERGVSSESLRDTAKAEQLAKQALVKVNRAQIRRAEAELEAARIRLGYTRVDAGWRGGNEQRVVAERYLDEGETVTANAPLLRIVELNPITAVFFVTESDYARLHAGQAVELGSDAFPGETFSGHIERIAPVFLQSTRQARVELLIENPDLRLKPGMFARASILLERSEDTTIIPEQALALRDDQEGVFFVSEDGKSVHWMPLKIGIRQRDHVEVLSDGLSGRVITLGQQLLDDGAAIQITGSEAASAP